MQIRLHLLGGFVRIFKSGKKHCTTPQLVCRRLECACPYWLFHHQTTAVRFLCRGMQKHDQFRSFCYRRAESDEHIQYFFAVETAWTIWCQIKKYQHLYRCCLDIFSVTTHSCKFHHDGNIVSNFVDGRLLFFPTNVSFAGCNRNVQNSDAIEFSNAYQACDILIRYCVVCVFRCNDGEAKQTDIIAVFFPSDHLPSIVFAKPAYYRLLSLFFH